MVVYRFVGMQGLPTKAICIGPPTNIDDSTVISIEISIAQKTFLLDSHCIDITCDYNAVMFCFSVSEFA